MANRGMQSRYASPLGSGDPPNPPNPRKPGTYGLVPALYIPDDYNLALGDRPIQRTMPGFFDYHVNQKDSFELDNWLRSCFSSSSGDKVEEFLRKLSPSDRKQLLGFYLTSKKGEGKGPETDNVIASFNIDPMMEFFESIGAIQNKIGVKKNVPKVSKQFLEGIKHLVDAKTKADSIIVASIAGKHFRNGQAKQLIFKENGLEYIYDERLAEGQSWSTYKSGAKHHIWAEDGGVPTRNVLKQFEEIKLYYEWDWSYKEWQKIE